MYFPIRGARCLPPGGTVVVVSVVAADFFFLPIQILMRV
jgi:hypothetical protein